MKILIFPAALTAGLLFKYMNEKKHPGKNTPFDFRNFNAFSIK